MNLAGCFSNKGVYNKMRAYVVPGTVHIYTYINTHPYTSGAFSNNPYKNQGYADEVAYFASF